MKKAISLILLILLALPCAPASASPEFEGETVRISFSSDMRAALPEPVGRWMDELFEMLTLRAERLFWEDGSLVEVYFLIRGSDVCSIGLLRLENDIFACGTLLPEGPVPLSGSQKEIFVGWPDDLFAAKGDDGNARYALGAEELAQALRAAAGTCLSLRVGRDEYGSLDAAAQILEALAGAIEGSEEKNTLLVVEMEEIENLYGFAGEEIDPDMLDGLAEEIVTRFIQSMTLALASLGE